MDRERGIREDMIAISIIFIWLLGFVCFLFALIQAVSALGQKVWSIKKRWRQKKKIELHPQSCEAGVGPRLEFQTMSSEEGIRTKVRLVDHHLETLEDANSSVFDGCPPLCAWTFNEMGELLVTFQEANPKWQRICIGRGPERLSLVRGPDTIEHPPSYTSYYFESYYCSPWRVSTATLDVVLPKVRLELFGPTSIQNFWSTPQDVLHHLDIHLSEQLPHGILKIIGFYLVHTPHTEGFVEYKQTPCVPKCVCQHTWAIHDDVTEKGQRILAMGQVEGWQSFWSTSFKMGPQAFKMGPQDPFS